MTDRCEKSYLLFVVFNLVLGDNLKIDRITNEVYFSTLPPLVNGKTIIRNDF